MPMAVFFLEFKGMGTSLASRSNQGRKRSPDGLGLQGDMN